MKCPKCNNDITEEMLVCPNCKKVLKLVCPKCKTVNKGNTCKKCGFTIVTKCHQCGKINQTISGKCVKCGFSTYTSVAISSSNTDEFACLTIEFPNLNDIKPAFGSTKLADKFKLNLEHLIANYFTEIDLTREIIDNVFVVRFNKDESFSKSSHSAINAAIGFLNSITELNFKLSESKHLSLDCKIAVLKRDINSKPDEYQSGFDIKLINQDKDSSKLLRGLQVITDSFVNEQISDKYDLNSLSATMVKNQMIMFFELNLKKYIKIPKPKKDDKNKPPVPKFNVMEDYSEAEDEKADLYEIDAINFNELKSTFVNAKSLYVVPEIIKILRQSRKKIISVKSRKTTYLQTTEVLNAVESSKIFDKVLRVTCSDSMKYKPYGFFYELLSSINHFSQSSKEFVNNNFSAFKNLDESGFVKDMINLTERTFPHPEDIRYSLFDIFTEVFDSMTKTLIYIENFEKIDDTSHEILQLLFEKFAELDVSYLIITNKDFPVHKNSHFLLANPDYYEITSKTTSFKEILESDSKKYQAVIDSFYFEKIAQNTRGNFLYFQHAIYYLMEKGQLILEDGAYSIVNSESTLIPQNLDELIIRRLKHLSEGSEEEEENENIYDLFVKFLFIGPRIDLATVKLLLTKGDMKAVQKLVDSKYVYVHDNTVYIQNYSLYKENFIKSTPIEQRQNWAKEILEKVFSSSVSHPCEAFLYKILDQGKQEFITWMNLSRVNASLGDFSAYLNCSVKFLKLLDEHVSEDSEKTVEDYKLEVYENISNLLYKYTPNEITNITQTILENMERSTDHKKAIDLCNKMLQGCLIGGNYSYALDLLQKLLSKFSNASLDPSEENFNISFFLISLIKIEVMFSIGNLQGCVESGEEILDVVSVANLPSLKPEHLSMKQFEDVIFDAMSFVAISRVILLQPEVELLKFFEKIKTNIGRLPKVFNLFADLGKLIKGFDVSNSLSAEIEDDKFSKIILTIMRAFSLERDDYKKFADSIYEAKISAKVNRLSQIELVCDLLIGYSYFSLGQNKKAFAIYQNVLDTSTKNGLKSINYIGWYFISVLQYESKNIDVAYGLASNSIVQLEKSSNSSDFLLYLFKILLSKIFVERKEIELAKLCFNNAMFIKDRYGLNYDLNIEFPSVEEVENSAANDDIIDTESIENNS